MKSTSAFKDAGTQTAREPIAIVGMGCRLPGASNPPEFWRLLMAGGESIREIPPSRLNLDELYDPTPATPGRIMTRFSGVVDGIETFDAEFFGIAPREAELVDPQQRLLLEVAWEAIEDAGIPAHKLDRSDTGVFVGLFLSDYESRMMRDYSKINFYMTLGTGRYAASGRLSYFLGLQGPSLTVDTACSSSLVAIHLACRSLWSGETNMALAGGANTILEPFITIAYSQSKMMAPDGRCKFGDASGNGYVRSEGAAIVALKRLSDAQAANDPIYAVILGGAVNNDGRGSGFLATPAQDGQEDLLRKAYRDAGVSPGAVQYVEAHGTGTLAGDPVEIGALANVLSEGRPAGSVCRIGSVKTNIGHTEGAAGVSGLMKVALALKHGTIPKSLHFHEPNPNIPWDRVPVAVQTDTTEWPEGGEDAIAGVSGFGISGTNAHLVLQAYRGPRADAARRREAPAVHVATGADDRARVLTLSAQTAPALEAAARGWAAFLRGDGAAIRFRDICYTASTRRTHHAQRLALVARTHDDAAGQLDAFLASEARPGLAAGHTTADAAARRVVFVFPGQGSQWLGMGRGLLRDEPAFGDALRTCDAAVRALTGWSVIDELQAEDATSRLTQIDVIQPVLFSVQVALAALWRSWGVHPDAVVGHSMGEVAAAHVAGALSIEDAARIICRRSALLRRTSGKGAMAVVELSLDEARTALEGYEDTLSVAVSNSRRSTVISGDPTSLDTLLAALEAREVFCRRVKVDVASHSPQMDPLRGDLLAALDGLAPREASVAFHSTVRARRLGGAELVPTYWVDNLREPVLFSTVVQDLIASGHSAFVEMSPHPLLAGAVQEMLRDAGADGLALASTRRDEDESPVILGSLGALHANGGGVEWDRLFESGSACVSVPLYPFQRERFWYEGSAAGTGRRTATGDLLGEPFRPAQQTESLFWEFELGLDALPSLTDHRVRGSAVVPAAMFCELVLEAASRTFGPAPLTLDRVSVSSALVLPEEGTRSMQVVLTMESPGVASFRVMSRKPGETAAASAWLEHASGTARSLEAGTPPAGTDLARERARCDRGFDAAAHYSAMTARGLQYGPAYQRVIEGWRGDESLVVRVSQPSRPAGAAGPIQARAALLDGCFQALAAALPLSPDSQPGDTYVPTSIDALRVAARPESGDVWCVVAARPRPAGVADVDTVVADLAVTDATGRVLIEARGLRLYRLERERDAVLRRAYHHLEWVPVPRPQKSSPAPGAWLVVADSSREARAIVDGLAAAGATVLAAVAGEEARRAFAGSTLLTDPTRDAIAAIVRANPSLRGVVHAAALSPRDATDTEGIALGVACAQALAGSSQAPPRLWFVTVSTASLNQAGGPSRLAGSGLSGLRSVIAAEHPQMRCSTIDLGVDDGAAQVVHELLTDGDEDQVMLRGQDRYVRRLRHGLPEEAPSRMPAREAGGRPYRAMSSSPGILDALTLETMSRRAPADDDVEVAVEVSGLNFMNVMSALGVYPGYPKGLGPLGIECAGRVVRAGAHAKRFKAGDRVMGFAFDSLATHAIAHERLLAAVPARLTSLQGATIPIAFLTSYYSLHHLARMSAGDRVLIHSAAGGVGQAALQLAQAAGAEVFATAGTDDKRAWLRERGVRYVGDSRSTAFAEEIREATGGEGVDIVLNSLAGDAIRAGLSLLRPGGRFVELGKRDIYDDRSIGLGAFRRNVSYFAVDLDVMARERPEALGGVFDECMARFESAGLQPLAAEVFPVKDVADAFRRMAQGGHLGKVVIEIDPDHAPVRSPVHARPADWAAGSYLITGGTGGLGIEVAEWMVAQGARDIVLMSRRGEGHAVNPRVAAMRLAGVRVDIAQGDVAAQADVVRVVTAIAARGAELKGVVHAAGVLSDSTIEELSPNRIRDVFAPKVDGGWNLHQATASSALEFFVLFSSAAAFVGSAGQGNYAAANAWLDALAAHRRASGQPGLSINWGPWSEVGLAAARVDRGDRLSARGLETFGPAVGVAAFGELLDRNPVQAAVMPFDVARWCESYPAARRWPLFAELLDSGEAAGSAAAAAPSSLRADLLALPAGRRRRTHLESYLQQQLAQVLKLAAGRIDVNKPLRTLGLDSLMALELRNRLEAATGAPVAATVIWNYPTISQLAPQIASRMDVALDETAEPAAGAPAPDAAAAEPEVGAWLDEIEGLSDEEVRRLLAEEH